jgi:hypothetical protein
MNPKVHLITFATSSFRGMGQTLGAVSIHRGFESFYLYDERDFEEDFKKRNTETLSLSRGGGYWLWKPYVILLAAQRCLEKDFLLYLDSGALPRCAPREYKSLANDDRIHVWCEEDAKIQMWTDPEVIAVFGENSEYANNPVVWAGAIFARNTKLLEKFAQYWLQICEEPKMLRPETLIGYSKKSEFVWHRHDQSILSLIVAEHPEWFVLHSSRDSQPWLRYFDRHRNLKIKYSLLVRSFPRMRRIRTLLVDKMPHSVRLVIREYRTRNQNRKLTPEEIRSLKKIY